MAKILIVDDSRTSRKILKGILENAGYEVIDEATNGLEGYDKYVALKPDLVTMDITMPVLDGIEALKKIKGDFPESKVVMVTAKRTEDEDGRSRAEWGERVCFQTF